MFFFEFATCDLAVHRNYLVNLVEAPKNDKNSELKNVFDFVHD